MNQWGSGVGVFGVVLVLCTGGEALSGAPPAGEVGFPALEAFAGQSEVGVSLEGVALWQDLRSLEQALTYRLGQATLFEVGRVLLAEPGWSPLELQTWLRWLLKLAGPGPAPVPAGVVAFSRGGEGPGLQALMKLGAGWEGRLLALQEEGKSAGVRLSQGEGGLHLDAPGFRALARVDSEGWFILSTSEGGLKGGPVPRDFFSEAMKKKLHAVQGFALLKGDGVLARVPGARAHSPLSRAWAQRFKSVAVTWTSTEETSRSWEVLAEVGGLELLGAGGKKPAQADSMVGGLGEEATDFLRISLPGLVVPWMRGSAEGWLTRKFPTTSLTLTRSLREMRGDFSGVLFSSPRDWVLGVDFESPSAAAGFVKGVYEVLRSEVAKVSGQGTLKLEFSGAGKGEAPLLHIQPDSGLKGAWLKAEGARVELFSQRMRLRRLSGRASGDQGGAVKRGPGFLEGPVTPKVKEVLNQGAILKGYTVLGAPGLVWDLLTWGAGLGELVLDMPEESLRSQLRRYQGIEDHFPAQVKLLSLGWMLTYDLAFSLRVEGAMLVAQWVSSDI